MYSEHVHYTCILYIYKFHVLSLCAVFIRQIYTMNIVQCTNAQWTMFNVHCSYICLMNTVHVWSTFMYLSEYSFWEMLCINVFLIFCLLCNYCNLVNVHTLCVLSNNYCILQLLYVRQMSSLCYKSSRCSAFWHQPPHPAGDITVLPCSSLL